MKYDIIEEIKREVIEVERKLKEVVTVEEAGKVKDIISKNNLIITYSYLRKIPSSILYWTLTTLNIEKQHPTLLDLTSFLTHVAPYRRNYNLLAITSNPNSLKRLYDIYKLLNINMLVLSENIPKGVKYPNVVKLNFGNTLFENNLGYAMYLSSLAIETLPENVVTRRSSRLYGEVKDMASIVYSLFDKYRSIIDNIIAKVVKGEHVAFIAPGYLKDIIDTYLYLIPYDLRDKLHSYGLSVIFEECPQPRAKLTYVVCRTGVEELSYRYLKFTCNIENVLDLNINVDPISAPIYLLLLMEYVLRCLNTVSQNSHNYSQNA